LFLFQGILTFIGCRTDVPEDILETIVPKAGGQVRVVRGEHVGNLAEVVEKNNKRGKSGEALLKFHDHDLNGAWLSYDDICEHFQQQ